MEEEAMSIGPKPIFLLADSQLLFWQDEKGKLFLNKVRHLLKMEKEQDGELKAAYIGASNGDDPTFYDIFLAAMASIDIQACRMILSEITEEDIAFLDQAHIILLAGGNVELGWNTFKENGLTGKILERYYAGTVLIGVSAGAVQLGQKGWREPPLTPDKLFSTFRFVPFIIDVHHEPEWQNLHHIIQQMGEPTRGLAIPSGSGAIFHPDWTVEPVRRPLLELTAVEATVQESILFPPTGEA